MFVIVFISCQLNPFKTEAVIIYKPVHWSQWADFYMITASVLKGLRRQSILMNHCLLFFLIDTKKDYVICWKFLVVLGCNFRFISDIRMYQFELHRLTLFHVVKFYVNIGCILAASSFQNKVIWASSCISVSVESNGWDCQSRYRKVIECFYFLNLI